MVNDRTVTCTVRRMSSKSDGYEWRPERRNVRTKVAFFVAVGAFETMALFVARDGMNTG